MYKIKRIGLLLLVIIIISYISFSLFKGTAAVSEVPVNPAFDDINFYKCVVDAYNSNNNTNLDYTVNLTDEQLKIITSLDCSGYNKYYKEKIVSVKGIEKLVNLMSLNVSDNSYLKSLDVSKNTKIEKLFVGSNQLSSLDVSNNTALTNLYASDNQLTSLNVSNNTALTSLSVWGNQLTSLDVSNNTALTNLYASNNQLTSLNVSNNTALTSLSVWGNQLTILDVRKNILLTELYANSNKLTSLDVSKNTKLTELYAYKNQLTSLDVSGATALKYLQVYENRLTSLDVSKNTALMLLHVYDNQLTNLDLSKNTAFVNIGLDIYNNPYKEEIYVYKGEKFVIGNNVKIPRQVYWGKLTWESNDTNIVKINSDGMGEAFSLGNVVLNGYCVNYNNTSYVNVVEITSNKYLINEEDNYIYVGIDNDIDTIKSNISISNEDVNIDIIDNKIYVKYGDNNIKEFDIVGIKLNNYKTYGNSIVVLEEVSYNSFINNIDVDNGVTYKIYNGEDEVSNGNIVNGMVFRVYYDGNLIDEYLITDKDEYYEFDDSLILDEVNDIISNIDVGISVDDIIKKINTNGTVNVLDKDNNVKTSGSLKTEDKIRIELSSQTLIYKVSVNGDVNGDGNVNINDVIQLAKYFINNDVIKDYVYIKAGDINNNGEIDINDIIKLGKNIISGN